MRKLIQILVTIILFPTVLSAGLASLAIDHINGWLSRSSADCDGNRAGDKL